MERGREEHVLIRITRRTGQTFFLYRFECERQENMREKTSKKMAGRKNPSFEY
jgi:hypothetical protein